MTGTNLCDTRFGPLIAERQGGALRDDEAAALDLHLRDCAGCRDWERDLRELAAGLARAAELSPLDHPDPARLAALADGGAGLPDGERARIERHLDACDDCRAEWRVATTWSPVALPGSVAHRGRPESEAPSRDPGAPNAGAVRPAGPAELAALADSTPAPFPRWRWFAGGALSAAAAAAVLLVALLSPRLPDGGMQPVLQPSGGPVQVRGAQHRAAPDATAIRVPEGASTVVVSLTVEAKPGAPLSVGLFDDAGRAVVEGTAAVLHDASGLLLLTVPAADLPVAGEFRVTVDETGEAFTYPFRLERNSD